LGKKSLVTLVVNADKLREKGNNTHEAEEVISRRSGEDVGSFCRTRVRAGQAQLSRQWTMRQRYRNVTCATWWRWSL